MRRLTSLVIAIVLMECGVLAQGATTVPAPSQAAAPTEPDEDAWSLSASAYAYFLADDQYLQPTVSADRGWLHLEARYNYEAVKSGSAWLGYNFGGGETVEWDITPMIGAVFGDATGIAPGYKGALSWKQLEFYSEGEYVFDTGDSDDSFLYNWSELTLAPAEWFRFGLVTQRTRLYQTERDSQRGVLAGFAVKQWTFTTYVLNPDDDQPTWVLAISVGS